jgi:SurA N-terminal domain/PPIC-type PPIASE domain
VKIAKGSGRGPRLREIGLAVLATMGTWTARAQQAGDPRYQVPPPAPRSENAKPVERGKPVDINSIPVPGVQMKAIPVNPSDAIAIVNGQPISRRQLADECVAKEGKKILDMMIHRVLIEQALSRQKLTVTAAEIDEEIDSIAQRFGISRDVWLRTLDKERGISPAQYAREIVYPAIALRKLCAGRVQVTPRDLQEAFESQYGEKLRVRMILLNTQQKAMQFWEELHANPGGFEKAAKDYSMDKGSQALGGLLGEPITRHAYPRNVSDSAFRQLVDGDPSDKDPTHKPKDGDITGPIQFDESNWILLRREGLDPPTQGVSLKQEHIRQHTYEMIYQVKLKEKMEEFFQALIKDAAIENRLTGSVKLANEERSGDYRVDGDVKLMGNKGNDSGAATRADGAAGTSTRSAKLPPPVALSPEAARQFRPLKPGGNPASGTNASGGSTARAPGGGSQ